MGAFGYLIVIGLYLNFSYAVVAAPSHLGKSLVRRDDAHEGNIVKDAGEAANPGQGQVAPKTLETRTTSPPDQNKLHVWKDGRHGNQQHVVTSTTNNYSPSKSPNAPLQEPAYPTSTQGRQQYVPIGNGSPSSTTTTEPGPDVHGGGKTGNEPGVSSTTTDENSQNTISPAVPVTEQKTLPTTGISKNVPKLPATSHSTKPVKTTLPAATTSKKPTGLPEPTVTSAKSKNTVPSSQPAVGATSVRDHSSPHDVTSHLASTSSPEHSSSAPAGVQTSVALQSQTNSTAVVTKASNNPSPTTLQEATTHQNVSTKVPLTTTSNSTTRLLPTTQGEPDTSTVLETSLPITQQTNSSTAVSETSVEHTTHDAQLLTTTTERSTLLETSSSLISTIPEESTTDIAHNRKRPPLVAGTTVIATESPVTTSKEVQNALNTDTPAPSQPTFSTGNVTHIELDILAKAKDWIHKTVKQYGPLKVSLALLATILVLFLMMFCCCKLCKRKGYRMHQRRLREFGQEKEFLLRDRTKKNQYNNDTVTLLDGSSEDEF